MEKVPSDPHLAPATWVRVSVWYATVWLFGTIGSLLIPNTDSFSYKVGSAAWGNPLEVVGSIIMLLGESLVLPFVLLRGFIFFFGNSLGASGLFLLIICLAAPIVFICHFIYFLRIAGRDVWLIAWVVLVILCIACIIGCSMNIGPNLIPGWT
jgi:hypothetical protein